MCDYWLSRPAKGDVIAVRMVSGVHRRYRRAS